ncbi:MAG: hypothetical protein ACE15D_04650 [Candidatus Eisenbacteria bacterium]|nr:hypothetical protein [Candidatus Eisenbacteria bacterium]
MTKQVVDVLRKYRSDATERPRIHEEFDSVAKEVSRGELAAGIVTSLKSASTPPFADIVLDLYTHATPEQRAGILNRLLPALNEKEGTVALQHEPKHVQELLVGKQTVSAADAERIGAASVRKLAAAADTLDPSVVEKIAEMAADHPALLKTLGTGILAQTLTAIAATHSQLP